MTDRYWLLPPGSNEPPKGPTLKQDLAASWHSGSIEAASTVCRVGDSAWRSIEAVLGPRPTVRPVDESPVVGPVPDRATIEAGYDNLASVSAGLVRYGSLLKGLAFVVGLGGLIGALVTFNMEGRLSTVMAFIVLAGAALVGVGLYAAGIMVAATGEALLAVRDTAVNTRLSSDLLLKAVR